jgi:hypothetical protein
MAKKKGMRKKNREKEKHFLKQKTQFFMTIPKEFKVI